MRNPQSFRYVLPAALLGAAICVMLAAVAFSQEGDDPRICPELIERVIPITHKGVRYENVLVIGEVPVPCEKPPSSARVETRINPNPVDVDREAVEGRWR